MLIYNALDSLIGEGLATVTHKKNIRLYQATDPVALIEKARRLHDLAKSAIPQLRKLQQNKGGVVNVRTLVGQEGFQTNLQDVVESASRQQNHTMCIIGGARDTDFYEAVGAGYHNYISLLDKHKVKKRLLAPASYSKIFKKKFATEHGTVLRVLPKGLSSPTYTRITEEMVSIELYHPQIVIIQIHNKAIATAYLDSFELLWKMTNK